MGRGFRLHREDEPRGERYDEPRTDDLWLDMQDECWRNERSQAVCGAKKRGADGHERCKQTATKENGRCRHHGGDSIKGKDHPDFKTGRYSKALPDNVAARFQEVRNDEHLTDLREEIALIVTRIEEVLSNLEAKDSAKLWRNVEKRFEEFKVARDTDDTEGMAEALHYLERLIAKGTELRNSWEEITSLAEKKRRLVDSERRREKALQAYIPMEDFVMSMHTVDEILRRHIDDPDTMKEIARDLRTTFDLG